MRIRMDEIINLALMTVKMRKYTEDNSINAETIIEFDRDIFNGLICAFKQSGVPVEKAEPIVTAMMMQFDNHPARLAALKNGKVGNENRIRNALLRIGQASLTADLRSDTINKYKREKGMR